MFDNELREEVGALGVMYGGVIVHQPRSAAIPTVHL
jgi:hypothetical protein